MDSNDWVLIMGAYTCWYGACSAWGNNHGRTDRFLVRRDGGQGFIAKYDERQKAVRRSAYRAGLLAVLIYDVLYFVLKDCFGVVWCRDIYGFMLGVLSGELLSCILCIRKDAYYPDGVQREKQIIAAEKLGIGLGLFFLLLGVVSLLEDNSDPQMIESGFFMTAVSGLYSMIVALMLQRKRRESERLARQTL